MNRKFYGNRLDYELTEGLNTPQEWIAVQQMKEAAKSMLWKYRDALVDKIETYTKDELLANIKSGESYSYWVREYLPTDEVIRDNIYGDE